MSVSEILFYLVILAANTIQGITGFAGTILAMPFALQLVGYDVAKPVLNVLGLIAGIYVVAGGVKNVQWKLVLRLCIWMSAGMVIGMLIKDAAAGQEKLLYLFLGCFVLFLGIRGLVTQLWPRTQKSPNASGAPSSTADSPSSPWKAIADRLILFFSGIVHGMFVCGGPLIIGYVTTHTEDKERFRRTISAVWIFLNGLIFARDLSGGMYTPEVIRAQLISIPFLFGGMAFGSVLFRHMSQKVFMLLTWILLLIAGLSLFAKVL